MVFNGEGCATIVLLYTYTESVEKKIMIKKGRKQNKVKKSAAQTWLDLNSAPLELLHGNGPIRLLDSVYVYNNYSENNLY